MSLFVWVWNDILMPRYIFIVVAVCHRRCCPCCCRHHRPGAAPSRPVTQGFSRRASKERFVATCKIHLFWHETHKSIFDPFLSLQLCRGLKVWSHFLGYRNFPPAFVCVFAALKKKKIKFDVCYRKWHLCFSISRCVQPSLNELSPG